MAAIHINDPHTEHFWSSWGRSPRFTNNDDSATNTDFSVKLLLLHTAVGSERQSCIGDRGTKYCGTSEPT